VPQLDREALRFKLNLPIEFMWKTHGASAESRTGMTRDISFKGLFVFANVAPPVGSAIRATVILSSLGSAVRQQTQASVQEGLRRPQRNMLLKRVVKTGAKY
jgi:hypothetical protein